MEQQNENENKNESIKVDCENCFNSFNESEMVNFSICLRNKHYCKNCFDSYIFECEDCKRYEYISEGTETIQNKNICRDCLNENYSICKICDRFEKSRLMYDLIGRNRKACEDCFNNSCFECYDCGRYDITENEHYCSYCEHSFCEDHNCDCDSDSDRESDTDSFNELKIPFKIEKSGTFLKNPYKRTCGIELETMNENLNENQFNYNELLKYGFNQISDGSLDSGGVEFTSNAFNGDLLFEKVNTFCTELNKRGFNVVENCGFHAHFKVKKNYELIKKIILFYLKFEKYFFYMVSDSRQNNTYCKKINQSWENIENKINSLYGMNKTKSNENLNKIVYKSDSLRDIKYRKKQKYDSIRYSWLNIHSIFLRGTLEIRLHNGTTNAEKINKWLFLHLQCLDFIEKNTEYFIKNMNGDIKTFLSLFDYDTRMYITKRFEKFNRIDSDIKKAFDLLYLKTNGGF